MSVVFLKIVSMSAAALLMIAAVVVVRLLARKGPKWIICVLWAMVAVKLICPLQIRLPVSLPLPCITDASVVQEAILRGTAPQNSADTPAAAQPENPEGSALVSNAFGQEGRVKVFAAVWCFGTAAMLLFAGARYAWLRRHVRGAEPAGGNVYICSEFRSPFILGFVRPRIILPSDGDLQFCSMAIKHEKAHIKRGDQIWKLLAYIVLALHWFNPAVWGAFLLFGRDMEYACDERVIRDMDRKEIADYTQALLDQGGGKRAAGATAFGETAVGSRVKRALKYRKPKTLAVAILLVVCLIVGAGFMAAPTWAKDGDAIGNAASAGSKDWVWPCDSRRLIFPFGQYVRPINNTYGFFDHIKLGAKAGENVYAVYDGTVESVGFDDEYRNYVVIKHGFDARNEGEIQTEYRCLNSIVVKEGEIVSAGQMIGTAGDTGSATSPVLRFCVLKDGEAVDPLHYYGGIGKLTLPVDPETPEEIK